MSDDWFEFIVFVIVLCVIFLPVTFVVVYRNRADILNLQCPSDFRQEWVCDEERWDYSNINFLPCELDTHECFDYCRQEQSLACSCMFGIYGDDLDPLKSPDENCQEHDAFYIGSFDYDSECLRGHYECVRDDE